MSLREARLFGGVAHLGQPLADRVQPTWRERHIGLAQVVEGIERGLRIARARQAAHQLARFRPHLVGRLAERAGEQPQQRAPALERLAHLMHRLRHR